MPDETEIRNAAENLVHRFGQDAATQLRQRLDELTALGETEAVQLWQKILKQVEQLVTPQDSSH